jgi:hypothetical protein
VKSKQSKTGKKQSNKPAVRCNNCLRPKDTISNTFKRVPVEEVNPETGKLERIMKKFVATTICADCKKALQKAGVAVRMETARGVL